MTLRQKLIASDNPIDTLWKLDPLTVSPLDIKALLLIQRCRKFDQLNFLALEAGWWIQENLAILKKRFIKKPLNQVKIIGKRRHDESQA